MSWSVRDAELGGHGVPSAADRGHGACRAITPRIRALGEKSDAVFAIDVSRDLDVARALGVMATPSTVEIEGGHIVGYHVGPIPEHVLARFA